MTPRSPAGAILGSWGLLFLLLAPLPCQLCPVPCECSEPARTVKCVQKELTAVPSGIPGYTRNLFITGNPITRIGRQDFQGLPNLVTLSLANNRINTVESSAFSTLQVLRYLDLSNNLLFTIRPEAFNVTANSVQELNLSRSLYNSSAVRSLETTLAQGGFQNLSRLELASNEIASLPSGLFSELPRLKHLDLRNNLLMDIKSTSFSGLNLKFLDLTSNAFKTLRRDVLSVLERQPHLRVFLKDNPFMCNCDIKDLVSWLNRSRQVADVDKLTCAFPPELQNSSLVDQVGTVFECHSGPPGENALQTSYAALGVALGVIGIIFLFVLYLNRKGIKMWANSMRDTCQNLLDEYRYHYEVDSDRRVAQMLALDI